MSLLKTFQRLLNWGMNQNETEQQAAPKAKPAKKRSISSSRNGYIVTKTYAKKRPTIYYCSSAGEVGILTKTSSSSVYSKNNIITETESVEIGKYEVRRATREEREQYRSGIDVVTVKIS